MHLYYTWQKVDGRVKWSLTSDGIDTKVHQLDRQIRKYMIDYKAFDRSLSRDRLFQLALYKNVYRGTLSDYGSLMLPYKKYYRLMLQPHDEETERPLYYNRNTKVDSMTIGKFLSTSYSVTPDGEILYRGKQLHKEFIPYDGYVVVNDKVCPYWHGFDRMIAAFDHWKIRQGAVRDVLMFDKDKNIDYYRRLGMLSN